MDTLTKEQRHKNMSHVRSKDTSIEVALRKALWHKGYRYRKNYTVLPGKPDIALTKYKVAVFCDSEFFHGKDWFTVLRPRVLRGNNSEYWEKKITRNMERDREVNLALAAMDWTVIRFWGNEIEKKLDDCVKVVEEVIFDKLIGGEDTEPLDFDQSD